MFKGSVRLAGLRIPIEVYNEIFSWLRPKVNPDMDTESYEEILGLLAPVCRYFAYYTTHESYRCLDFNRRFTLSRSQKRTSYLATIIESLRPIEALRTGVKECSIAADKYAQFSRFLPRLNNLRVLTISKTRISYILLQNIGRLQVLEEIEMNHCTMPDLEDNQPETSIFGKHEMPFPALRQLTADLASYPQIHRPFIEAFSALRGAPTLRSLTIPNNALTPVLLPYVSQHILSLFGCFSDTPLDSFLQFITGHPSLQNLTLYFESTKLFVNYDKSLTPLPTLPFAKDDLPDLRSFSGPPILGLEFIRRRPVTKLSLGGHPLAGHDGSLYNLAVFPFASVEHDTLNIIDLCTDDVWRELEALGGGIRELFVRFEFGRRLPSVITSCFPNLVHLHIEAWLWYTVSCIYKSMDLFSNCSHLSQYNHQEYMGTLHVNFLDCLEEVIRGLKHLTGLTLSSLTQHAFWVSPGDQHSLVHRLFQQHPPTLRTIVFSPWMVWHLRTPSPRPGECHCELELLITKNICDELQWQVNPRRLGPKEQVRDWNGKLASVVFRKPFAFEERTQKHLEAMIMDA